MKVLFIEPKKGDRFSQSLVRLLRSGNTDYTCHIEHGLSASQIASTNNPPDVVVWKVTYRNQGVTEAFQFSRWVRNNTQFSKILLIFVRSFDSSHPQYDSSEARSAGFDHDIDPLTACDTLPALIEAHRQGPLTTANILFIEHDKHQAFPYESALTDGKLAVDRSRTVAQALKALERKKYDLVVLDVMMPAGKMFTALESAGTFRTGLALARRIRDRWPELPLVALTYSSDAEVVDWFTHERKTLYLNKEATKPRSATRLIKRLLRLPGASLNIFIVHGRSESAKEELKAYLAARQIGRPIVLAEQPSNGLTLIEKFERYGHDSDIVFVLVTPDDRGYFADQPETASPRARQNIWFEVGYFFGILKRHSGRVILLHKGEVEVPSDLKGIVYLDFSNGLTSVHESLDQELKTWIGTSA